MISIGEGHFHLESAPLNEKALRAHARHLFKDFDRAASDYLPLEDYGLHLEVEQGSIKGKTIVLASLGALYVGVGQFGSFIQGLREIGSLAKTVNEEVLRQAPSEFNLPQNGTRWRRSDSATLGQLRKLFDSVARGELAPADATRRALELLEDGGTIPDDFARDLEKAVGEIKLNPQQLDLWRGEIPDLLVSRPLPERRPGLPRSKELAMASSRNRLRIEVHREHKDGKTVVRLIAL